MLTMHRDGALQTWKLCPPGLSSEPPGASLLLPTRHLPVSADRAKQQEPWGVSQPCAGILTPQPTGWALSEIDLFSDLSSFCLR